MTAGGEYRLGNRGLVFHRISVISPSAWSHYAAATSKQVPVTSHSTSVSIRRALARQSPADAPAEWSVGRPTGWSCPGGRWVVATPPHPAACCWLSINAPDIVGSGAGRRRRRRRPEEIDRRRNYTRHAAPRRPADLGCMWQDHISPAAAAAGGDGVACPAGFLDPSPRDRNRIPRRPAATGRPPLRRCR